MQPLLIHIPRTTGRLRYIFKWVFAERLGIDHLITPSPAEYDRYTGPKLYYAPDSPDWPAHSLLFEDDIQQKTVAVRQNQDDTIPLLFAYPDTQPPSALVFDVFAAVFYLISRYEEYGPNVQTDYHDRYKPEQSVAAQNQFLHLPLVDYYVDILAQKLRGLFPKLPVKQQGEYRFFPTVDVDNYFAFKHKGLKRTVKGVGGQLLTKNFKGLTARRRTLTGSHDPFDTYDEIQKTAEKLSLPLRFFFSVGDYGPFDKNPSHKNKAVIRLIKRLSDAHDFGLHPSHGSFQKQHKLTEEQNRLKQLTDAAVSHSRYHYIRFALPESYRQLVKAGIMHDYSMGYATQNGFRAGTAHSFLWYDLQNEIVSTLRVQPFAAMDATFLYHEKKTPEQALAHIEATAQILQKLKAPFYMIFHNESLGNFEDWTGWSHFFKEACTLAANS